MSSFDLTILYAVHSADPVDIDLPTDHPAEHPDLPGLIFPNESLTDSQVQILKILEDDLCSPRLRSLEALSRTEGTYTIFLDEGDQLSADFFRQMLADISGKDYACILPAYYFKHSTTPKKTWHPEKSEERIIDTSRSQLLFPIDLHGLLIPTDFLKEACAFCDEALFGIEPEKLVILRLLSAHPIFYYEDKCLITYAFPKEQNGSYDQRPLTRSWYYDSMTQFLLPYYQKEQAEHGYVTPLAQMMGLFMINNRVTANFNNRNRKVLSREEAFSYADLLSDVLQYIEVSTILRSQNEAMRINTTRPNALLYLQIRRKDYSYRPDLICEKKSVTFQCDGHPFGKLSVLTIRLQILEYQNGKLEIDGSYFDLLGPEAKIAAKFDKEYVPLTYNQRYSMTKFFGVTAYREKTFHVSIPVPASKKDRKLNFVLLTDGHEYTLDYEFPVATSRFSKEFDSAYWLFGKYMCYRRNDGIHVRPSTPFAVLKKEMGLWKQMKEKRDGYFKDMIPFRRINLIAGPILRRKPIWLFMDKIYKGGDSSEYLYRYACKQKDGVRKYYLLDETSADYARMKKEGYRPLKRGSLKHKLIFQNADTIIASNSSVHNFNGCTVVDSLPIRANLKFDTACVQHGMSIQKIAIAQQRIRDNTGLYFCASKYEIENLSKPVYNYEGTDALQLTGVPRYDGLKNRAEKIILLAPTWRMNSVLPKLNESFARGYNPNFRDTDYFRVYNQLINDQQLLKVVRSFGYRIKFVLHPIISPQCEDFTPNDLVDIVPSIGDMSYEKILCEGALMITDYSGVQFDFAYMRKPVVYLHHNDIPQHYEEGTFHYDTMGFGEICHTNGELIDTLCRYMEKGCKMSDKYRQRADDFFQYSDHENCARIYPILLQHTKERRAGQSR